MILIWPDCCTIKSRLVSRGGAVAKSGALKPPASRCASSAGSAPCACELKNMTRPASAAHDAVFECAEITTANSPARQRKATAVYLMARLESLPSGQNSISANQPWSAGKSHIARCGELLGSGSRCGYDQRPSLGITSPSSPITGTDAQSISGHSTKIIEPTSASSGECHVRPPPAPRLPLII